MEGDLSIEEVFNNGPCGLVHVHDSTCFQHAASACHLSEELLYSCPATNHIEFEKLVMLYAVQKSLHWFDRVR